MSKKPPLTTKDIERGLAALGFQRQASTATSHVKWIKKTEIKKWVVTVDAHHSPFSQDLIKSMANQAGISVKHLYEICSKEGQKKAKRGVLAWIIGDPE